MQILTTIHPDPEFIRHLSTVSALYEQLPEWKKNNLRDSKLTGMEKDEDFNDQ